MRKLLTPFFFIFCSLCSYSQNVGVGTNTPHASAALEVKDSARGILIPRITATQRTSISSPAEGLMVYQTDGSKGFWYYDGAIWKNISASSNTAGAGSDAQTLIFTTTGF
jgi:hypothetical protein